MQYKKYSIAVSVAVVSIFTYACAFAPKETAKYFNGPTVSNVSSTTAMLSLSGATLADITEEERTGLYFEYDEIGKVCIMIYPTPPECLPKKTAEGSTTVVLANLKPNTKYYVKYRRDNTIRCITTPCPGNEYESLSVEFVTKGNGNVMGRPGITRGLSLGSRGSDVKELQTYLIQEGYLQGEATGYYGKMTVTAVRTYQKAKGIAQTGTVGPKTREMLRK
jgi:hypothetical protein